MPLYHVQDDDLPLYVVAPDFHTALLAWQAAMVEKFTTEPSCSEDPGDYQPEGLCHVADDCELLITYEPPPRKPVEASDN